MAVFSFSLTSAWVLPSTFLMIRFPVLGSYPAVYRPYQRPSFLFLMLPSPLARFFSMLHTSFYDSLSASLRSVARMHGACGLSSTTQHTTEKGNSQGLGAELSVC